ncbi:hypothetical protein L5515_013452 [Caenorhabditis briggsae]|uniref:Uncharacterized protein n=1 Tax=Caenorhabditis briggsae TaxID=6238 RepID=A0AAE9J5G0_CAEBR|nr:hypothetical protein L5515_013452 [Caenorhabditis briggsae]
MYNENKINVICLLYFSLSAVVIAQQPQFTCPNNANPLVANSGTNLFCTSAGSNTDCPTGSICTTAANAAGILICCSQSTNVNPVCPNSAISQPSNIGYVECQFNNPTNCISGYQCVQSANLANTFICCSTSASVGSCPSDFTPAVGTNGGTISCNPSASTCPSGSSCMQSTLNTAFICCRSANSQRICANNQNALITNGALELCTTPGTQCSSTGYTCQLSVLLATYVCCGQGSTGSSIGCADGRPVYQQRVGETYTCDITSSLNSCPSGYDCALSDDSFVNVCCLTGSTPIPENLSCPTGWNPFRNEVDNAVRTCTAVLDTSCPIGFSCAPSNQVSQFLCCRLASSLVCINGKTLLVNGAPKLCTPTTYSQCPYNYSCQQSVNPTVTVCCSNT